MPQDRRHSGSSALWREVQVTIWKTQLVVGTECVFEGGSFGLQKGS